MYNYTDTVVPVSGWEERAANSWGPFFLDCLTLADEGTILLQYVRYHAPNDTASHHRRPESQGHVLHASNQPCTCFLLVHLTWQWTASLRVHNLFQLENNALERDFSGIKMRHKHEIFKSLDKIFRNQSHYYCRLHHMFNTPYHYCQLWWPKSCRQKSFVAAAYQSTHFKRKQDSYIYIHICPYKWVWMRNHVLAGHIWRLPNLECKTDISVSISLAGLNRCTSVSCFLPISYNSDI